MKLKFGDMNKPRNNMSGILTTNPVWGDMKITKANGTVIIVPRRVITTPKATKEIMKAINSSENIYETAEKYGLIVS